MLQEELLVVTNLPFLASSLLAFSKGFWIWSILLTVVFVASTAYHTNHHSAWMKFMDRACAGFTILFIGGLALLHSSRSSLSMGLISGIVGLCMFLHDNHDGYNDPAVCLTHSLWHILAALSSIIFIQSF